MTNLRGKQVSEEMAKEFMAALGLDGSSPVSNETELGSICGEWMKRSSACSPEVLVEALILTPGLGKFASGIVCKLVSYPCTDVAKSCSHSTHTHNLDTHVHVHTEKVCII